VKPVERNEAAPGSPHPTCFVGIRQLVTVDPARATADDPLGVVEDAAIRVAAGGRIEWLGRRSDAQLGSGDRVVDLGGGIVTPALVDPHTHLVFAGDRAADFAARCAGESYAAIAARGGGIQTTVNATREASQETLVALAAGRVTALMREGVGTVEVKTGYGLSPTAELAQLDAIAALAASVRAEIVSTLLLHKIPPEGLDDREAWVGRLEAELLPAAQGRASFVDIFVETGAFTRAEGARLLRVARRLGFSLKAHTEQLTASGFGADAAQLGATSLEHLEHAAPDVLDAMAAAGTVAVLLPGASAFLGDAARPPVAAMRARGIPMALGTDFNPGSSATASPWLIATLGCTLYGLTPTEALLGLTRHAARAIACDDRKGVLAIGRDADFLVARVPSWLHLLYGLGHHPVAALHLGGAVVAHPGLDLPFA
jgi:imidazolonepropionase